MPRTYQWKVRKNLWQSKLMNSALERKTSSMSYRNSSKNMKSQNGQTILFKNVEKLIVENLITCSSWDYPLTTFDLRSIVKSYLDSKGTNIKKFKNNVPGIEFVMCFLRYHRDSPSQRISQNIKISRKQVLRYLLEKMKWIFYVSRTFIK